MSTCGKKGSGNHNIVLVHSIFCSIDIGQQGRRMVFLQCVVIFSLVERGKSVDLSVRRVGNHSFGIVHSFWVDRYWAAGLDLFFYNVQWCSSTFLTMNLGRMSTCQKRQETTVSILFEVLDWRTLDSSIRWFFLQCVALLFKLSESEKNVYVRKS